MVVLYCGTMFQNFRHTGLLGGAFILGVKKERPANAQPQQGLEHGALRRNSQTFTPVPIAHTARRPDPQESLVFRFEATVRMRILSGTPWTATFTKLKLNEAIGPEFKPACFSSKIK